MPEPANHFFLPWTQSGAAANIPDTAKDTLGPTQPGVVALSVKVVINADTVEKNVRLYGPGEITGIDPQQVVRTEPRHLTSDFEPNYFPGIEFDRPDFPWLFTPAKSDAQGRLRPWLCLVVVRKQPGIALRPAVTTPLPVLEITPRPGRATNCRTCPSRGLGHTRRSRAHSAHNSKTRSPMRRRVPSRGYCARAGSILIPST